MAKISNGISSIPRSSNKFLYVSLGIIVVVFAIIIIIIWQLGFFDFTGTDASSTVVAAAVALVGAILGGVVSVVGILIKHSYDQQNLQRQWEAERRLNLEATIRAIDLFSTSSGKPAPDMQRDSVLFTLAHFGQEEITIELVDDLLGKGRLSAVTASKLFSNAILRGNQQVVKKVLNMIYKNPSRMLAGDGVCIPECLLHWVPGLPEYVREEGIRSIAEVLLTRPLEDWRKKRPNQLKEIMGMFCTAWEEEQDPQIKQEMGAIIDALGRAFPSPTYLLHNQKTIILNEIRDKVRGISHTLPSGLSMSIVTRLRLWVIEDTSLKKKGKAVSKSK